MREMMTGDENIRRRKECPSERSVTKVRLSSSANEKSYVRQKVRKRTVSDCKSVGYHIVACSSPAISDLAQRSMRGAKYPGHTTVTEPIQAQTYRSASR